MDDVRDDPHGQHRRERQGGADPSEMATSAHAQTPHQGSHDPRSLAQPPHPIKPFPAGGMEGWENGGVDGGEATQQGSCIWPSPSPRSSSSSTSSSPPPHSDRDKALSFRAERSEGEESLGGVTWQDVSTP